MESYGEIGRVPVNLSKTKLSIFARRIPKGDRKALWWGDGAKPHIQKVLRRLFSEMFGLRSTDSVFLARKKSAPLARNA